jgi:hypothetical protein
MNTLDARVITRNDLSSVWAEKNPILMLGEMGIENDTNKIKVGNGVNTWNDLPYVVSENIGKSNITIVENFGDLPEVGESDVLYKINST